MTSPRTFQPSLVLVCQVHPKHPPRTVLASHAKAGIGSRELLSGSPGFGRPRSNEVVNGRQEVCRKRQTSDGFELHRPPQRQSHPSEPRVPLLLCRDQQRLQEGPLVQPNVKAIL
jgi:hypothetical protein